MKTSAEKRKDQMEQEIIKDQQKQQRQNQQNIISLVCLIIPLIFMITSFFFFQFNDTVKQQIIGLFERVRIISLQGSIILILVAALLIITSFPYMVFQMSLGFIYSYPIALAFALGGQFLGEIICFVLSRSLLQNHCRRILDQNQTFLILRKAAEKNSLIVSVVLRVSIVVPIFVANFGSGLLEISFNEFVYPAIGFGFLYSSFAIYCGKQLNTINEVITNSSIPKDRTALYIEIGILIGSLILMTVMTYASIRVYNRIKLEIEEENQIRELQGKKIEYQDVEEEQQQQRGSIHTCVNVTHLSTNLTP